MKRFIRPFKTATIKDISVLLFGNVSSVVLGFVLTWVLTRSLNPSIFGIFVTARAFIQLVFKLLEFGFRPAILNFYSGEQKNKERHLKAIFILIILLTFSSGSILFFLNPFISEVVFKSSRILPYLQISIIGIIFFVLISGGLGILQARKRFFESTIVTVLINLSRVLITILVVLLFAGEVHTFRLFLLLQLSLLIPIITLIFKIDWKFLKSKINFFYFKKVYKYVFSVGIGYVFVALYSRIDQFFVFNFLGEVEAGIYGLAFQLGTSVIFFTYAFSYAMIPRFVSLKESDFKLYFSKTILLSLIFGFLLALVIPLCPPLFLMIFGDQYAGAIIPFQIFLTATIFFLISLPFSNAVLYRFKKTWFQTFIYFLSLIIILFAMIILIPKFGIIGGALSVLIMYLSQFVITLLYFFFLGHGNILVFKELLVLFGKKGR